VILTSRKGMAWAYFFAHKSLSEELSSLHHISYFLRKELMEPTLCFLLDCPSFDHARKCLFGVFFRDKVMWNEIWLFTRGCFQEEFLEFQSYSEKSFWCLFKTNLFWKIQTILIDRFAWALKNFVLLLVKWSDVWLVKMVQASIWGFQRTNF